VGCEGRRAVADVAADADPTSGVAVYDSVPYPYEENGKRKTAVLKWVPIGGTSLASPIVAALFALAGGAHGVTDPARTLYSHLGSPLLHDVGAGGNGECDASYTTCSGSMKPLSPFDCGEGALICNAAAGYDGPTGVGTPASIGAFTISGESPGSGNPESKSSGGGGEETGGGTGKTSGEGEAVGSSGEPSGPAPGGDSTEPTTSEEDSEATQSSSPTTGFASPAPATIHLSGLALTARATAAARHGHTELARIAFAFTVSASASVRVALARAVRVHGHLRWVSVAGTFTLARTSAGRNHNHLRGRATLAAGVYRLTLTPVHGAALSRTFLVG
ncbi:MAG TPA: hypothetical protein VGI76_09375, partial [Solirubrobacteraceae bacterium]